MNKLMILIAALLLAVPSLAQYKVGQEVEAYNRNAKKWVPVNILQVEPWRCYIHYKGFEDDKYDSWVQLGRLKRMGELREPPLFFRIGSTEQLYSYYATENSYVFYLTPDSAKIQCGEDIFTFKKMPGNDFLTAKQKIYESNLYLAWVDNNSFVISRSHNNLTYYHRDVDLGNKIANNQELGQYVDSALVHIRKMEKVNNDASAKNAKEKQFNTVTNFVKTYASKKNDPQLSADITKWWNGDGKATNPLLKIYIANSDYTVKRNDFGVILHKYVTVLLAYRMASDGKCYVKWLMFGYENIGGQTYSKEMKTWVLGDGSFSMGGMDLNVGVPYEVDCAAIK